MRGGGIDAHVSKISDARETGLTARRPRWREVNELALARPTREQAGVLLRRTLDEGLLHVADAGTVAREG